MAANYCQIWLYGLRKFSLTAGVFLVVKTWVCCSQISSGSAEAPSSITWHLAAVPRYNWCSPVNGLLLTASLFLNECDMHCLSSISYRSTLLLLLVKLLFWQSVQRLRPPPLHSHWVKWCSAICIFHVLMSHNISLSGRQHSHRVGNKHPLLARGIFAACTIHWFM